MRDAACPISTRRGAGKRLEKEGSAPAREAEPVRIEPGTERAAWRGKRLEGRRCSGGRGREGMGVKDETCQYGGEDETCPVSTGGGGLGRERMGVAAHRKRSPALFRSGCTRKTPRAIALARGSALSTARHVGWSPPPPPPPPPPFRTKWTRLVHLSVLTGHCGSRWRRQRAGMRRQRGTVLIPRRCCSRGGGAERLLQGCNNLSAQQGCNNLSALQGPRRRESTGRCTGSSPRRRRIARGRQGGPRSAGRTPRASGDEPDR